MTALDPELGNVTLGAFPHYPNNPWQRVMYAALADSGAEITELAAPEFGAWVDSVEARGRAPVLHLNWTAAISQAAGDIERSWQQVESALASLERSRDQALRVLWTVHNVLPHDPTYLIPEIRLCRRLAELVDAIIVMNSRTEESVRPWYRLPPERIRGVPLPSYVGVYPDSVGRTEARGRFGIDHDAPVLVAVGVLRPYKGLEELVAAMPDLALRHPGLQLLIAGEVGPGYSKERVRALTEHVPGVHLHVGYVPDDELQFWFRAADAAVLPYRSGLNSGAMLLAAGFGLPVIMTASDAAAEVAGEAWAHVIRSDEALVDGVSAGLTRFDRASEVRRDARSYAEERAPGLVSERFAGEVRRVLQRRGRGVGSVIPGN